MSQESEKVNLSAQIDVNKSVLCVNQSTRVAPNMNGQLVRVINTTANVVLTLPAPKRCVGWTSHFAFTSTNRFDFTLQSEEATKLTLMTDSGVVSLSGQTSYTYPCPVAGSMLCLACDGTRWIAHGGSTGLLKITSNTTLLAGQKNQLFTVTPRAGTPLVVTLPTVTSLLSGSIWRFAVDTNVAGGAVTFAGPDTTINYRHLTSAAAVTNTGKNYVSLTGGPPAGTIIEVSASTPNYYVEIYGSGLTIATN